MGMFRMDHMTNVGYLRNGSNINNKKWTSDKSALAFSAVKEGIPEAVIADLDESGSTDLLDDYKTVVKNLRLIKSPGKGVWQKQDKRWSEAAVAVDDKGRILFLFCRSPLSIYEFNQMVLSLPLGVIRACMLRVTRRQAFLCIVMAFNWISVAAMKPASIQTTPIQTNGRFPMCSVFEWQS